jgi:hypothetical protein
MAASPDRRAFLQTSAALSATNLVFPHGLPAVSADEAKVDPNLVQLDPEIEPVVRLIEETPRNKLLEEMAGRVKNGLPYRDVLASLLLAGVRNIQPRPSVGFKFHAVLVVNSAHLASQAGPDRERWLPIFWALDNFKSAQAQNQKESGWRMRPAAEMKLPPPHSAREVLIRAMDSWDVEAADVATAALARSASTNELFELFVRYGCRDFRDIGHKAIFVANAFRTLATIGRQHAEPVLRSLAYALLAHEGDNPAKRDAEPDRPGRRNIELARRIQPEWRDGKPSPEATADVLAAVRTATSAELSDKVLSLLNGGVAAGSVWDGLFVSAAELLMRQPGIVGLHTLTTLNALHYSHEASGDDETRKFLLLQAASFLPLFREAMKARGKLSEVMIDTLNGPENVKDHDVGAVFAQLSKDKLAAAQTAIGFLRGRPAAARELIDAARLLVFLKGTDAHDYKFSAAVMEDSTHIAPAWRDRFLAASLFWMKGSGAPDSPVAKRTQAAIG